MSGQTTSADTFATLWRSAAEPPDVFTFVAGRPGLTVDEIVAVACVDQQQRWRSGRGLPLDEYLHRLPQIGGSRAAQLALAVSEYRCRRSAGESPAPDEYADRFPGFSEALTAEDAGETVPAHASASIEEHSVDDTATVHAEEETLIRADEAGSGSAVAVDTSRRLLGDYELIEEIARGGMGVVVKARHVKLHRTVALKMILAGQLANEEDIRRFYVEAEAAARLDHPNIVPIYEVGEIDGQHFFSMRLVEGSSLAGRIAAGPLSPRDAARTMRSVAAAVQYAHERGVIHRDLKPANVLLDRDGEPMVTDFGLAKPIESDQGLTASGQILGTPGYMAPEQALGKTHELGPACDIYALGAVLYALLTGRPPFQSASVLETLRHVVEREPVPPRQLNPSVPRDLETICLKCLSKEPGHRYPTAQALRDDLDLYLSDCPVTARPVGVPTRFWRWCRRNPIVASLSAAVVISLVVGTAVSTSLAITASRRAAEAEANFIEARRNFERAWEVVDRYLTRVSENTLLNQPGMQPLQHELLQEALDYYRRFAKEHGDDPQLREELAGANFRVGLIAEVVNPDLRAALPSFERALEIQDSLQESNPDDRDIQDQIGDTLTALSRVRFRLGELDQSLADARRALDVRRRLAVSGDPETQRELANSDMNLALLYRAQGDLSASHQAHLEAQSIRQGVLRKHDDPAVRRDLAMGFYNLANLSLDLNDNAQALDHLQSAIDGFLAVLRDEPDDLDNDYRLGVCYRLQGELHYAAEDSGRAVESFALARDRLRNLADRNPEVSEYRSQLADLNMNLGQLEDELNDVPAARQSLGDALRLFTELNRETPSPLFRRRIANTLHSLSLIQWDAGEHGAAIDGLQQSADLLTELTAESPDDESLTAHLSEVQSTLDEFEQARSRNESPTPGQLQ